MNEPNDQGSEKLVDTQARQPPVQLRYRRLVVAVPMLSGFSPGQVAVHVLAVSVQMRVEAICSAPTQRSHPADLLDDPCQVPHAENNQHQGNGHFHRKAEPRRDHDGEEDDSPADRHDRQCMPHSPQAADQEGRSDRRLAGYDRADGDHVIGVCGMAHAEKEAQQGQGEDRDHVRVGSPRGSGADAPRLEPRLPRFQA